MSKELYTILEFCEAAHCSRTRAYQLLNEGQINAIKNGRKTLIARKELLRWIDSLQTYSSKSDEK